jgi:hypothetical protein
MEMLMTFVNNEQEHPIRRRRAYRTMQSIRRKMNDKTILRLRLRLIAASIVSDHKEAEKIGERIEDYERHHYINRKM